MLKKFTIFHSDESQRITQEIPILLNLDHLVSLKPIKMTAEDRKVINGYWIRMSNGKKYKAVQIPSEVTDLLSDNSFMSKSVSLGNEATLQ